MSNMIPNMNFSKHMKQHRFEAILSCLQFSPDLDKNTQVLEILATDENLVQALNPGNIVTLDESMIKYTA